MRREASSVARIPMGQPDGVTRSGSNPPCDYFLSRRQFLSELAGTAAFAAAALLPAHELLAQVASANSGHIDVHSHYAPPAWVSAVNAKRGHEFVGNAEFLNAFKDWTPAKSIEQMDQAGIATSMV